MNTETYLLVDAYTSHEYGRFEAASPLAALDSFAAGEGFASYTSQLVVLDDPDSLVSFHEDGSATAVFANTEIHALPLAALLSGETVLTQPAAIVSDRRRGRPSGLSLGDRCPAAA